MHRTVKPDPHHLRDAARIVAVRLVDLRLQHRLHVPRLNTDHRQARFGERAVKPLRQRPSFQSNSLEVVGGVRQHRQQRLRFAGYLHFPNDLARVIHNADAGLLDRYVQSSKMVHAALLLLMLEAVDTDLVFTISLKRSTQNLQISTRTPADYSIYGWRIQLIDATPFPSNLARWNDMHMEGHAHGSRRSRRLSSGSAGRAANGW